MILLAIIPFAVHRAAKTDDQHPSSNPQKTPTQSGPTARNPTPGRSQRSPSQNLTPSHKTEDLKNFLLPPTELTNVTLQEALDALFTHYREICLESGERSISFRYKINGTPEPISFLKIRGDFLSNCKYIATLAGTTVEIDGDKLIFTEIEDGPVAQRRWTVPPTFQHFVFNESPKINGAGNPDEDPFASLSELPEMGHLLTEFGVIGENDTISFLPSSSTLIIQAGAKDLTKIDGLVNRSISNTPIQTRLRFLEEEDEPLSIALIPGNLGSIERSYSSNDQGPNYQLLVLATEQGFGRKIQTVSFTGEPPTNEARTLYLETRDVSDLGISENLTSTTYNISRTNEGEPQTLSFKDEQGTLHEKTFVTERIDATGRAIPVPTYEDSLR